MVGDAGGSSWADVAAIHLGCMVLRTKMTIRCFLSLIFNMELRMHNGKFEGNNWWCFVNEFVKISLREPSETGVQLIY